MNNAFLLLCKIFFIFLIFHGKIAFSAQIHYFVLKEDAVGALSIESHQIIDANEKLEGLSLNKPQASRLKSYIDVFVNKKTTDATVYKTHAYSSPWLRGEFHGEGEIDGKIFQNNERFYVVKVPLEEGTILRATSPARSELSPQAFDTLSSKSSTLEVDLDNIKNFQLRLDQQSLPAGYFSGNIFSSGAPENRLDLLIVSEGYTSAQKSQFISQATSLINLLLSISPYREYKHLINVSWLFVPSNQSGADKPSCPETPGSAVIYVDTAFDGTYCRNGIRRLVTVNESKVFQAAASVPAWDQILVLVNDTEYGGSGGIIGVATTNEYSAEIMQHELGHSFTDLADEYETAYPGFPSCSDKSGAYPCEANVTNETQRSLIKWRGWINATTAIPTAGPLSDPIATGLWQGARYSSSGMYRQCFNGMMRSLQRPFCHVDSEAFVSKLFGGWGGSPAQGINLIENQLPSNTQIVSPLQSDVLFQGTLVGSKTQPGLAYTWLVNGVAKSSGIGVHGNQVNFSYRVLDAGPNTVELRVTEKTPLMLSPPSRSHTWVVTSGVPNTKRLVTLSKAGTGTGSVSSSPSGLSCTASCSGASASFASTSAVTLTAQAASGSTFAGWSGACSSTSSSCTIPAGTSSANVTASYQTTTAQSYTLSVVRQGAGSGTVTSTPAGIGCGSTCTASYAAGASVTLTAYPASGSSFTGWGGACSGTSSCTVSMDSARSVTASFGTTTTTRPFTLNKAGSGTGSVTITPPGVTCEPSCTRSWPIISSNAVVTLVAQASVGSTFAGWSGACTGTGSCTIPPGTSSVNVTAQFNSTAVQNHMLSVSRQGTGSGSISSSPAGINCGSTCTASYASGTQVTLSAQADAGSSFAGWSGACTGTNSSCTVSMDGARGVTANFISGGGGGPLPDPVQFVTQQYLDFLGRSPESTSLSYWVSQLNAGSVTRAQLIESFMYSNEFQGRFGPLVRLYTAYFRRIPDYSGLMYWFNTMYPSSGGGAGLADVSQAFAQSAEFVGTYGALDNAGFVALVYQNVLGRDAEPAGFAYWLDMLNRGMTRGQMMIGFSESIENQSVTATAQRITLAYVGMLRRTPSASEHAQWLAEIKAGRADVLSLLNSLLQSAEYANRF